MMELGDLHGARLIFEKVVEAYSKVLPDEHPDLQRARQSLAETMCMLGDLDGARLLLQKVVEAYSKVLPDEHVDLARARQGVAVTMYMLGDLHGARVVFEKVVEAYSKVLPDEHRDLQGVRMNLAVTMLRLGDLRGARALLEKVVDVLSRTLPDEHPDLQAARMNLAGAMQGLGDLQGARVLSEKVLEIFSRTLPDDHPDLLLARQNLAVAMKRLGDFYGARMLEEKVLEVRSKMLPDEHQALQQARQNLAITKKELGDLQGARVLEEKVLEVYSRALPDEHADLQAARLNLATTTKELGDSQGARAVLEKVLEVFSKTLPDEHPDLQEARGSLAATMMELGDLHGARLIFEKVLEVSSMTLSDDHPKLLRAKQQLAATKYELGDLLGARELIVSLLEGLVARARSLHAESPRAAREGAHFAIRRLFEALCLGEAVHSQGALERELFAALEELRHATVLTPEVALALAERPKLAEKQREITRLRSELSNLATFGPREREEVEAWREELVRLGLERDRLEGSLRSELSREGVFAGEIDAAGLAEALSPDAVALSYLRYPRRLPKDPVTSESPLVDSLLAFLVWPDGKVDRIELGPAREIEALVAAWREALGASVGARGVAVAPAGSRTRESDLGLGLRERILDPVLARAPAASLLYVVLEDFLHLVPLEALPIETDLLGDRYRVRTEVSFGRLIHPPGDSTSEPRLLLAGGIDYEAELGLDADPRLDAATPPVAESGTTRSGGVFLPLPGTEPETVEIAGIFEEAFRIPATRLSDGAATKATLADLAPRSRFLHLATHGWFASEKFRSQLDSLGDETDRASFDRVERAIRGFAPETLCGIAFAGANNGRDALGRVPGILTAEELSLFDLRGCELAVLSACETNVGIRRAGQGIQSLQAALHGAGVRTAVTSLWKVSDLATRLLMVEFYRRIWEQKQPKAEALWEAKRWLRELPLSQAITASGAADVPEFWKLLGTGERDLGEPVPVESEGIREARPFEPPRYWAAWVLSGDPD